MKKKIAAKKVKPEEPAAEAPKPQFVTEVVEEVPAPSLSEGPEDALEEIKEKAEEIEEVVEEIQQKQEEQENGETQPVEESAPADGSRAEEKEVLAEIFAKEPTPSVITPEIFEHKRTGGAPVFLWAVIIIGVALLTGGTLLAVVSGIPRLPAFFAKPTPTPTPAPTPTPTPAAQAARGDITLQVLNGGGTPGSAGKAKTFLEEKGYSVTDVGNTEEYTYETTEIHVQPGKEAYLEFLKEDLAEDYTIGTAAADLSSDAAYEAQVIVGKE